MNLGELEVVWPLHRWHYLTLPAPEIVTMDTDDPSLPLIVATPAHTLAARALAADPDCSQQRVSELLGVSRRTIGRMADADLLTALRDPQALEMARTCLAETASRGSTAEERDAALAWLEEAARDEHQVARVPSRRPAKPAGTSVPPQARALVRRAGAVHRSSRNGTHRNGSATATIVTPALPAPLMPVDALRREQQRILHRSTLIDYVLAAEKRNGDALTMGDALAELLADITEAARTIGTLLQANERSPLRS